MNIDHGLDVLWPTVLLLGAGFLVIFASRLLRLSPIIGFVMVGVVVGPYGAGVIEENSTTKLLAELGVVFLLFDIGLHFSYKSALSLRRDLFGLAPLQVFLSGLVLGSIMALVFGLESKIALLAGLTLALSSTAVVMQMIADLRQTESPAGQTAKAILIFQDLAAIFLLIFADSFAKDTVLSVMVAEALIKTGMAFGAAIILGRYILSPLMKAMTRFDDPEMFTVFGLFVVMLTGMATGYVGLSLSLGAFLAGMVLAETPFRVLLQSELRPFRSLLLALFFITIGMMLDPAAILAEFGTVISLAALLIGIKGALMCALIFVFRRPAHHAIQLPLLLAQGGEFAFVIFSMPAVRDSMGAALTSQLIAAVAFSMLITPLLAYMGYRLSLKACAELKNTICNMSGEKETKETTERPVFIVGMNEIGKTLARAMKAHKIPYIAVDQNRQRFLEATAAGYITAYGQSEDLRFWNTLGAKDARAVCVATPHYEIARKISPLVKRLWPDLKRYIAVKDSADGVRYAALGLVPFHGYGTPPGLPMACFILREFGIDQVKIDRWTEEEQAAYLEANPGNAEDDLIAVAAE